MAGKLFSVTTPEVALVAATAKTALQLITTANDRIKILSWSVAFDGTSATGEPVQVRLVKQTTAIGGTPTAVTPVKVGDYGDALQVTAAYSAGGAEPTSTDVYAVKEVHPQTMYEKIFPLGQEIPVPGSSRIGIECTAPAGVNVRCEIWGEE